MKPNTICNQPTIEMTDQGQANGHWIKNADWYQLRPKFGIVANLGSDSFGSRARFFRENAVIEFSPAQQSKSCTQTNTKM